MDVLGERGRQVQGVGPAHQDPAVSEDGRCAGPGDLHLPAPQPGRDVYRGPVRGHTSVGFEDGSYRNIGKRCSC